MNSTNTIYQNGISLTLNSAGTDNNSVGEDGAIAIGTGNGVIIGWPRENEPDVSKLLTVVVGYSNFSLPASGYNCLGTIAREGDANASGISVDSTGKINAVYEGGYWNEGQPLQSDITASGDEVRYFAIREHSINIEEAAGIYLYTSDDGANWTAKYVSCDVINTGMRFSGCAIGGGAENWQGEEAAGKPVAPATGMKIRSIAVFSQLLDENSLNWRNAQLSATVTASADWSDLEWRCNDEAAPWFAECFNVGTFHTRLELAANYTINFDKTVAVADLTLAGIKHATLRFTKTPQLGSIICESGTTYDIIYPNDTDFAAKNEPWELSADTTLVGSDSETEPDSSWSGAITVGADKKLSTVGYLSLNAVNLAADSILAPEKTLNFASLTLPETGTVKIDASALLTSATTSTILTVDGEVENMLNKFTLINVSPSWTLSVEGSALKATYTNRYGFEYRNQSLTQNGTWFTAWDGEQFSNSIRAIGPRDMGLIPAAGHISEAVKAHPWVSAQLPNEFSIVIYTDLSAMDMSRDNQVLWSAGSFSEQKTMLVRSGNDVRLMCVNGTTVQHSISLPIEKGYHLYWASFSTDKGIALSIDNREGVSKSVDEGIFYRPDNGFQIGAVYAGVPSGYSHAMGMPMAAAIAFEEYDVFQGVRDNLLAEFPPSTEFTPQITFDQNGGFIYAGNLTNSVNFLQIDSGTLVIPETAELSVPALRYANNNGSRAHKMNLRGKLNITGASTSAGTNANGVRADVLASRGGILMGEWTGLGTYNISGTLDAPDSYMQLIFDAGKQTYNISGTVNVKGFVRKRDNVAINLMDGARLNFGGELNCNNITISTATSANGAGVTLENGTLVLPAGFEGKINVGQDAVLKLYLNDLQEVAGYHAVNVTLPQDKNIIFIRKDGTEVPGEGNRLPENLGEANYWLGGDSGAIDVAENWSLGVPVETSYVCITNGTVTVDNFNELTGAVIEIRNPGALALTGAVTSLSVLTDENSRFRGDGAVIVNDYSPSSVVADLTWNKTLQLALTANAVEQNLNIGPDSRVKINGEWGGDVEVAGTLVGNGAFRGDLTFEDNAKLQLETADALSLAGALSIGNNLTLDLPAGVELPFNFIAADTSITALPISLLINGEGVAGNYELYHDGERLLVVKCSTWQCVATESADWLETANWCGGVPDANSLVKFNLNGNDALVELPESVTVWGVQFNGNGNATFDDGTIRCAWIDAANEVAIRNNGENPLTIAAAKTGRLNLAAGKFALELSAALTDDARVLIGGDASVTSANIGAPALVFADGATYAPQTTATALSAAGKVTLDGAFNIDLSAIKDELNVNSETLLMNVVSLTQADLGKITAASFDTLPDGLTYLVDENGGLKLGATTAKIVSATDGHGWDYTNRTFTVVVNDMTGKVRAEVEIRDRSGNLIGVASASTMAEESIEVPAFGELDAGQQYTYIARIFAGDTLQGAITNNFFAADNRNWFAFDSETLTDEGVWSPTPDISERNIHLVGDYRYTPNRGCEDNAWVNVDTEINYDGFATDEDYASVPENAQSAILIAQENNLGVWKGIIDGQWRTLDGGEPRLGVTYVVRAEFDYTTDGVAKVRYSVRTTTETAFTTLTWNGNEWNNTAIAGAKKLNAIRFVGDGSLMAMSGNFTSKMVARVNGVDYATLGEALRAAGNDAEPVILLTNATVTPDMAMLGSYRIESDEFAFNVKKARGIVWSFLNGQLILKVNSGFKMIIQ